MTSINELERRLEALERKINEGRPPGKGEPFRILLHTDVLPGPRLWAYAGTLKWRREADEPLEVFATRAAVAAEAAGETSLILGGLPRGEDELEGMTFEQWWESLGPHSDVPPEEAPRHAPRSRLGWGDL